MAPVPVGVDTPAAVTLNSTVLESSSPIRAVAPHAPDAGAIALEYPGQLEHEVPRPRITSGRKRAILKRTLEVIPALTALTVITSLIWGPLLAPVPFALAILAFHAYWLWRAQMNGIHAFKGFLLLRRHKKTDWRALYDQQRADGKVFIGWEALRHIVVIPNYTETAEKLRPCLDSLAESPEAKRIIAVLAIEEREGAEGRRRAEMLQREYQGRIGTVFATHHPWGIPGEVAGKSSNENWAARRAKEYLVDRLGHSIDEITITSCDADTVFDRNYFGCLTYHFLTDPNRYRRFWQAPFFFYNNIWDIPAPLRFTHALAGMTQMGRLTRGFLRMRWPVSTYSLSLRMAHDVDYWDPDIIPEDWHMFLKCYYRLRGEVDVEPLYTPTYMDGIRSRTYIRTFVSHFHQARRHAWGCTDIPYAVEQTLVRRETPLVPRLRRLWAVTEAHVLWSTQWFLVTAGRIVPVAMTSIGVAAMPEWFPLISKWLLLPCGGPLVLFLILDAMMRPKRPASFRWWHFPIQYAQWFGMAFITFFSSALPALDAQFRLALGKRLEYKVTEKA
jgi:hypothetical protein